MISNGKLGFIGETVTENDDGNTERYVKKFNSLVSTYRFLKSNQWNTRIEDINYTKLL